MRNTVEKLYKTFLDETAAGSAHIECTIAAGLGGNVSVSASGNKAFLFCCACEILKELAQSESEGLDEREKLAMQKRYVTVTCETVLVELEQEGRM